MRKIYLSIALSLGCLPLTTYASTGQKPRPRPGVRREPGEAVPVEKPSKWGRGQPDKLQRSVEGPGVDRPKTDRETRSGGGARTVEKADRWDRGQRKVAFERAVLGEVVERTRTDRDTQRDGVRRQIEKAEWWERKNQIKDDFNKVANPKPPPDRGGNNGGNKDDSGGSAPPAAPAPKPPHP